MKNLVIMTIVILIPAFSLAKTKEFTLDEVAKHSSAADCWMVIKGKVYDFTEYIPKHPTPPEVLTKYCGKVADKGWETKDLEIAWAHSRSAERLLKRYEIGTLKKSP